jgi:peptidoglycan/LPS O-acetylase OafA/YrhL
MTGPVMNVPKNVLWFEALLYASLMLDALSVAFQDRTPTADLSDQMITLATLIMGGMIVLLMYFVWLAARRRKNWPRWVLSVALGLSFLSLLPAISETGMDLEGAVGIISCALTAAGLYFSYTGDAQGWFNA